MDLVTLRRPRPFYPPTTGFSHNIFFRLILSTTTSLQLIVFVLRVVCGGKTLGDFILVRRVVSW